jgi:glycosyltransferase involved in cell wall biosynthesis
MNDIYEEFTVVVPCFNEEQAISETVVDIAEQLGAGAAGRLIVVDDGSKDRSVDLLTDLAQRIPKLEVISHDRNLGYGAALKTGIARAHTDLIVITDADGSYPIDQIETLARECADFDMVVGARTGPQVTYSRIRSIPKAFLTMWVSWIARQKVPDINSGMRVFRKQVAERYFPILPNTFSFTITLTLAMLTNYRPVKFLPINYMPRVGRSKIEPVRDTMRFISLILRTGMYFAPMRILAPVVFALGLATLGSLIYDISLGNLTDKSVILAMFTLNTGIFALLADMIDKRSGR